MNNPYYISLATLIIIVCGSLAMHFFFSIMEYVNERLEKMINRNVPEEVVNKKVKVIVDDIVKTIK
jgi:hypothetical protein